MGQDSAGLRESRTRSRGSGGEVPGFRQVRESSWSLPPPGNSTGTRPDLANLHLQIPKPTISRYQTQCAQVGCSARARARRHARAAFTSRAGRTVCLCTIAARRAYARGAPSGARRCRWTPHPVRTDCSAAEGARAFARPYDGLPVYHHHAGCAPALLDASRDFGRRASERQNVHKWDHGCG